MIMKKSYERLVNIGNYENIKVGVTMEKEVKAADAESIRKAGAIIGELCKQVVEAEVKKIKAELVKPNVQEEKAHE